MDEEESEAAQEIEALKAIWPEMEDRPPVWNSPAVAVPVCPLGSLDAKRPTRVTVVVIFNPRYPKVPPRVELESPCQLSDDEVAKLKHMLEAKAAEVAGTGMVMVHDLLVLTNDFLSDKNRADEERSKGESLFQKMLTEEQRQRDKREEEELEEERRQRDEEAKQLQEEEAKGEAHWAVVREKLEQKKERAASVGFMGAMEGVIPEISAGDVHGEEEEEAQGAGGGGRGQRGGLEGDVGRGAAGEEESSASDDSWMNDLDDNNIAGGGEIPGGGGGGVDGAGTALKERSSWYRSQFKELENLGKGGFGTVVKVRNRVDRRLYAVKKVGLDPFDKETNRKIRREVTTISTLIHKNIVRYYQAWLEGGGGAFPAAVAEEEQDDDDDDNGGDTATSVGHDRGRKADMEDDRPSRPPNLEASLAAAADKPVRKLHGRGEIDINPQGEEEEEEGEEEEDQSEAEAGLGFFRTTPDSSSRNATSWNSKSKKSPGLPDGGKAGAAAMLGGGFGDGGDGGASGVRFDSDTGGIEGGGGGGDGGRVPQGRKAKRLLRKQARKNKRLLGEAAGADGAGAGGPGKAGGKGKGRRGGKRAGQRTPDGGAESVAAAAAATAVAPPAAREVELREARWGGRTASTSLARPTGALWARKRRGRVHSGSFGSGGARSSSSSSRSSSSSSSQSSSESDPPHRLAGDWSDGAEEGGGEGVSGGHGDGDTSGGSWGSESGDYQAQGQGKLVSDAEFFQFCGSPERVRQESAPPPLPASWSSEDALMQHYKQATQGRGDRGPAPSSSSSMARPSTADQSPLASPSMLPRGAVRGGAGHDGHDDHDDHEKGEIGRLGALMTPQPAIRAVGERQFLYIQMEYCENTLRHLIDHGELWREEQRCWRLIRQMLEGVDFIHSKGIIHRDLTPPNVFLDGEENVKLGDFGLATSKKARPKVVADMRQKRGLGMNTNSPSSNDELSPLRSGASGAATLDDHDHSSATNANAVAGDGGTGSVQSSAFAYPSVFGEASMSGDTSQLTDGVGTGPYIAPEQGARFGQYNHKADMWSLGVILFEMLAPRFSTLMERAEVMTALRAEGGATFPPAFEERVPDNAKQVIRWLLDADPDARPTAAELLSSALLPPKLEVEASYLREALRVMGNPDSDTFQVVVKALLDQETAEHVEHWYDHEPLGTVAARIPNDAPAVSYVCGGLRRVFETHGATPVAPPTIRPKPPPSLAAPPAASKGLVRLLDHKGAVVMLPGNLTAPFARFVARSGVTRLKRYQIDRIFLASGPERSCTEAWEADFDIISSSSSPSSSAASPPFYGAGYSAEALGDSRGGGQGDHFEVAEAEAVLVVSQVMGAFETFVGPWFLRLGNVNMSQAILELCGVSQEAKSTLTGLLGKLARGVVTPAKAFSEVESKGALSAEALANVRPFLQHMGVKDKDPFETLTRLEVLVHRIPAVRSVLGLTGSSGRRRELSRKEAVRTKRSLRMFRDAWGGLKTLVEGLARLGLIPLPPLLDLAEEETGGSKNASKNGPKNGPKNSVAQGAAARGGKGSGKRRQRLRGDGTASPNSTDKGRVNSRADGGTAAGGGDRSDGGGARGNAGVRRTGGEVNQDSWKGGVVPSFVVVDLGLTQRQGSYASGTVFQAVLEGGGPLSSGKGGEGSGSRSSSSSSSSSRGAALSMTVAEGGRYDDLVAKHRYHLRSASNKVSGASGLCAVGVRFAVEKLASMLVTPRTHNLSGGRERPKSQQQPPAAMRRPRTVDAVVCAGGGFEPQGLQERVLVAARLWAGGIRAEYLATDALVRAGAGKGGGLEGAAEACLSLGIPFVVVVRPHTLVAKKAVKVMSVMEKGGGQLEVPLERLAQHMADALAALAGPAPSSTQGGSSGGTSGHHHHHHQHQPSSIPVPLASSGGAAARLELVDRGQGPLEREKMSRQEFKTYAALERKVGALLDTAMAGPVEDKREGDGPLVLATDASFAGVRALTTCYMLYGSESRALAELLSDHPEKKNVRNLLSALQEVEAGGRRRGGNGGKGQQQGSKGGGREQASSQSRQVFVYSLPDEMMDLVTFIPSGSGGFGIAVSFL
eukprot:g13246.t1